MAPRSQGLYNPAFEHDACGVAMVADMHGRRSRDIVDKAITALVNLEHRGAQGAEPHTGDGAGILLQVPDEFLRAVVEFDLPEYGSYATGIAFLPQSSKDAATACEAVEKIVEAEGLDLQDDRLTSALGIVHSRFSTNTFPSWPLAHPFRRIAHNGEINTVTGNENWMRAREALISTDVFGSGAAASRDTGSSLDKIVPVCTPGASDTARFDEVLELLHLGGRSL